MEKQHRGPAAQFKIMDVKVTCCHDPRLRFNHQISKPEACTSGTDVIVAGTRTEVSPWVATRRLASRWAYGLLTSSGLWVVCPVGGWVDDIACGTVSGPPGFGRSWWLTWS